MKKIAFIITGLLLSVNSFFSQTLGCQAGKSQLLPPPYYSAENLRSDTFDIIKYTVSLEVGNFTSKQIKGNTKIRFAPKINGRTFIRFDLLKLTVDSVKEGNVHRTYTYNDTILKINLAAPMNTIDTANITVYYKGQPQMDQSGWGGFYFDNTGGVEYAYNLGVGFKAAPHNYGRVWHPCFDNFVERARYEFIITTDTARRAYCNGTLTSDIVNLPNRTRTWIIYEQIPTYLASISVAKYRQVNWTVNTLNGTKPIVLAAAAGDTTAVKNGFVNLKNCIAGFENYFGPYKWNRFGYCMVPFNSGAMEHATNISYPRAAAGLLVYEADLMAHELSHHWWGDLITCQTQEDMWINEGMATFSGYMFLEWQYGKDRYLTEVKNQHATLLHQTHRKEKGFRAISGVPHEYTYGDHVYRKGADVAHTLRSYMGDVAFFNACKYAMQQKEYKHVNSNDFRDLFQTSSGQNLNDFFNNWVFAGGWPHFSIDSVKYVSAGGSNYNAIISIKQKVYGTAGLYSNVPLEVSFFKSDRTRTVKTLTMTGASATFTLSNISYSPVYAALNYDSKISDATSFETKRIRTAGPHNFALARLNIEVANPGNDTNLIRIIHNYVKPDPFKANPKNHKLSNQHYWKVEGLLSQGFKAGARFYYDGNPNNYGLDTILTVVNGDSVRLFYRKDAAADWELVMNVLKFPFGNKDGFVEIYDLKTGEYAFGNSTDTTNVVGVSELKPIVFKFKMYPNPASQTISVSNERRTQTNLTYRISDLEGRLIEEWSSSAKEMKKDLTDLTEGLYIIEAREKGRVIWSDKLVIER